MEWLENKATCITTAPITCRPRFWRRYVDDVLEIVRKGDFDNLTENLNKVDPTNSIKFNEEEEDGAIPFLDTLIMRKPDGLVKLCIYRKKTHTDQYLQFSSHHPLHQKLGVIRTLLDRSESIVTEVSDREKEELNIRQVLTACGYPEWTVNKVKQQRSKPKSKPRTIFLNLIKCNTACGITPFRVYFRMREFRLPRVFPHVEIPEKTCFPARFSPRKFTNPLAN